MTDDDLNWVGRILDAKKLDGPCLELGVGYGGGTCRELVQAAGITYFGTDLEKTPAVDFVANFEDQEDMNRFSSVAPFGSILILNVLEHTFDPIRILDSALSILRSGGHCAVLTPSIWPLGGYLANTTKPLRGVRKTQRIDYRSPIF